VEALFIARQLGYRLVELPVYFHYLGEQSNIQLVKDSLHMLRDLWLIRQHGARGQYLQDPEPAAEAVGSPDSIPPG
jgi:hypothetical protein